ncbi:MAG TPA: ABC transporter permease [Candidatus Polarisedimenticolia bacterium]|nr:ABC transporter permease [Candidatus Polarisedimenticolia bacterium]
MDAFLLDLKYGVRSLWRDKGFALTVLLTFSVCLAANAALFAIVNSVVLRPLPVFDANSILIMSNEYPKAGVAGSNDSSSGDYFDRLRKMTAFESQAIFRPRNQTVELNGSPQQIRGMLVTPSWFRLLRVSPSLGRAFTEEEGEIANDQKVILSHGLWKQLYAADKSAIGRELRISGRPFTIVGVMPADFNFIDPDVRLWIPLGFTAEQKTVHHSNNWYHIGRLKPGATLQQAQAQVNALNNENLERFPEFKEILINAGFNTRVKPLQEMLTGGVKGTLYLLWGGAILVLLIGGLNIANLALARLALRRKELATRIALGAGRAQLMRQLIVENLGLALLGGIGGVALGAGLLRTLSAIGLEHFPRAGEVHMDSTVILVSLALSLAAGLFVGLFPLAGVSKIGIGDALHEDSRTGTTGKKSRGVRQLLVAAQIGFAFALLVGAGLLLSSFRLLLQVDPGFNPNGVVTASVGLPRSKYPKPELLRDFMNRALPAIRVIPGVSLAGATEAIPLGGNHNDSVILAEGYQMKSGESLVSPLNISVTPGYFEALGISVVRGRSFDDRDNEKSPRVIIVDERLAQHFWPNQDPLGRRMYFPGDAKDLLKIDERTVWMTVVGVARTLRYESLDGSGAPVGAYYLPNSQRPAGGFTFALKTSGDPGSIVRAVRSEIAHLDPDLAVFDVHSMSERIDLSLSSRRTSMLLANAFGGVALFLASLGIYGVLAYLVARRTREIGIRVALGSTRAGVLKLVLREGLQLVAIGLVLGVIGAASLQKAVATEIYGIRPLDPFVLASVMALLAIVALAACAVPARRAMLVAPTVALRYE